MLNNFVSGLARGCPGILVNLGDIPSGPYDLLIFKVFIWSDTSNFSTEKLLRPLAILMKVLGRVLLDSSVADDVAKIY